MFLNSQDYNCKSLIALLLLVADAPFRAKDTSSAIQPL